MAWTPMSENGTRLSVREKDLKVLAGDIQTRRVRGLTAIVEIKGRIYKWYARSCGLPNCMCDAMIKEA